MAVRVWFGLIASCLTGAATTPEERAIDYLVREVPAWYAKNGCFSCHHDGDGARVLYSAGKATALTETTKWLRDPGKWDQNRGDPAVSDKKLARIQFAGSLAAAVQAGAIQELAGLRKAAALLAADQASDGKWAIDQEAGVGSPATYGSVLATYMARRTLEAARDPQFARNVQRANNWLRAVTSQYVMDVAAVLLALPEDEEVRTRSMAFLKQAQTSDGAWGPRRNAPAEPFDTALVLLALVGVNERSKTSEMIKRGREFLISTQEESGGWPGTTRPAGSQSYAQHTSTTAWATLALLATDPKRK
jgi:Squalene-hopene cyclase C-terminal domain